MSFSKKIHSPRKWIKKPLKSYKSPRNKNKRILKGVLSIIQKIFKMIGYLFFAVIVTPIRKILEKLLGKPSSGYSKKKVDRVFLKKMLAYVPFIGLFAVIFLSIFSVAGLAWFSRDLPSPDRLLDRQVEQSTKIYDRTGETILYEIYNEKKRTLVELDDIPEYVKNATIVAEDRDFYNHHGFDLKGILRSVWRNIFLGQRVGGSTITQQFIKNAILSPEKTYTRKIKELALSIQLERKFSKDEILKMYFNEIPYGSTSYGIQSAAQTFFGKNAGDLDLAEGALLAALPQAPTRYSPSGSNTDILLGRQNWILDSMVQEGYLSEEEASGAKEIDVLSRIVPRKESIIAPHFVMHVKEILTEKYGEKLVEQGGLKVYTTIDVDKQKFAEEAIDEQEEANETQYGATNAALVSIDPNNGQILAMVGSKDYFNADIDGNVNVALRLRQPGSSFKPIVYAAAFQKGFSPKTTLFDLETVFKTDTRDYIPHNYDGEEHGPVSMRKSLAGSLNIPAVKTLYLAGKDYVLDLADTMGYTSLTNRSRFGLSLVLGGGEVKLLEHTNAFASFASEGMLYKNTAILKVEDASGKVLEEWEEDRGTRVLDKQTARQVSNVLSDDGARSYVFGSGSLLTLPGRPVAAKTGTTNDWRDGWTMGYTPSLVTGVWVGNNNNKEMRRGADGSLVATPIWNSYMRKALEDSPVESFTAPKEVTSDKPILNGEIGPEVKVKIDKSTGKLATELTPESFAEEKTWREVHTILFYVDKNNPNGPSPEEPESDPQFATWEAPIQQWAEENEYTLDELPTEYDDIHTEENKPTISIISPVQDVTIDSREITAQVTTSAPRGVSRVEYFINDTHIKTAYSYPFNLFGTINNGVPNGFHVLKAIAYDDVDNSSSAEININLMAPKLPPSLSWINPRNDSSFYLTNFPLSLTSSLSDLSGVSEVVFYYQKQEGEKVFIQTFSSPTENEFSFEWSAPEETGVYAIFAEIQDVDGEKFKTRELTVNVL